MKPLIRALIVSLSFTAGLSSIYLPAAVETRAPVGLETDSTYQARKQARLQQLYERGVALYEAGDLPGAHAIFEEMLLIDPENAAATTYLDNMQEEWERYQDLQRQQEEEASAARESAELMNTPITIETIRPTALDQFLNNLSFASGMNFAIASGVEATVSNVKFIDIPLAEVLDAVLLPIGLQWSRENGVVLVQPALETQVFRFNKDELEKVQTLYESRTLQRILWGPDAQPDLEGEALVLDARDFALIATDSRQRLQKLSGLLTNLEYSISPGLETRIYRIQEDASDEIRALIDAVISTAPSTPFDLERRVYVDGSDLIIRETPGRLVRIEAMLRDEGFMEKLVSDELDIQAFSLIPRQALEQNREYMQSFANRVVEQVQTYLYAQVGIEEAQALGRRMWFDPNTLTLVVADSPDNLTAVGDFLDSLPELRAEERFKVIYLKYALADDLEGELSTLLGLTAAADAGDSGLEVTQTLRREQEFTWRDITVTVRSVTAGGDAFDEFDDSAELIVRVEGSRQSTNMTLNELDVSQYVTDAQGGEYELYAEDIRATGNVGEGRIRLVIRYTPPTESLAGP